MARNDSKQKRYCFQVDEFKDEDFDPQSLVSRFVSREGGTGNKETLLKSLQQDLENHLESVRNHLLALVHRDYADFVTLSTELEGVDAMLMECRRPVLELRKNVMQLREGALHALDQLQSGAERSGRLQQEAAHIELNVRAVRALQLAEKLMAESEKSRSRDNWSKDMSIAQDFRTYGKILWDSASDSEDLELEVEDRAYSQQTKASSFFDQQEGTMGLLQNGAVCSSEETVLAECATVERVARLLSHVHTLKEELKRSNSNLLSSAEAAGGLTAANFSRSLGHEYDQVQAVLTSRISHLEGRLLDRLEVLYGAEISPDLLSGGEYRTALNVNTDALSYCFRAYSCLGSSSCDRGAQSAIAQGGKAAAVFAQLVMEPYLDILMTLGNLDGRPSSSTTTAPGSRGSCSGLPTIFTKLCTFIKSQCGAVVDVLRKVKADLEDEMNSAILQNKSSEHQGALSSTTGFCLDILCEGISAPIAKALEDKFSSQLFSFTEPDRFHLNFCRCKTFFETDLPHAVGATVEEREMLMSHASTRHFWSLWTLPIYFGLRKKAFIGQLEKDIEVYESQMARDLTVVKGLRGPGQTAKSCAEECWNKDKVFLDWLAPRFFELSLELGDKYNLWFQSKVESLVHSDGVDSSLLRVGPALHKDMEVLASAFTSSITRCADVALSRNDSNHVEDADWKSDAMASISSAFAECASRIRRGGDKIWDVCSKALIQKCTVFSSGNARGDRGGKSKTMAMDGNKSEDVATATARAAVKAAGLEVKSLDSVSTRVDGIARTFRFSSSRPLPTVPSDYVMLLTLPLSEALDSENMLKTVNLENKLKIITTVLSQVATKFRSCLETMLDGARKTEASLQRVKKMASSNGRSSGLSDLAKIVVQVGLDVACFYENASKLIGSEIDASNSKLHASLSAELEDLSTWAKSLVH